MEGDLVVRVQRKAVGTTAIVGAVIVVAVVVGAIAYYVGQSGSIPSTLVTATSTTTIGGVTSTSIVTDHATSTSVTTVTSTSSLTSTAVTNSTKTVTTATTVFTSCSGCVNDDDGDGI